MVVIQTFAQGNPSQGGHRFGKKGKKTSETVKQKTLDELKQPIKVVRFIASLCSFYFKRASRPNQIVTALKTWL